MKEMTPCQFCAKDADPTKMNEISKKEWAISGLCQECQDMVFGKEEEDDVNL